MIALADGRAQSPGETLLRWALRSGGLPPPELQVEVVTRRGRFFADLGWPALRVAVEFDGYVKYSGAFGSTAPEAVFAEKQRQDALEEEGWRVLRVTWDDLRAPAPLVARVARALSRSSR
ncbi:endonuclease domain-containing protein [Cellulomonas sp. ACRRI]|uniref:endonuclease domain-containing protein n=1 Tax=Cellulomonas sp. ACRRI TaxID=2918188 RepID=UPI001EF2781C|nr:endonuclease domain-containing protein [Cellulomonas sp. ACRRI]MCG7287132.1 endonuclease domain-containing protein [Cellulomonas sp. ACRRI]